jgi:hypothetical protein
LVTCCFDPFLCKGVTFASFQVFGIFLVSIDFWNIFVSGSAMFFKENIPCIMDENGELQTDNKIKAELLNKF